MVTKTTDRGPFVYVRSRNAKCPDVYFGPISVCSGTIASEMLFGLPEAAKPFADLGPFLPYQLSRLRQ